VLVVLTGKWVSRRAASKSGAEVTGE
jgi:hypothetical protein